MDNKLQEYQEYIDSLQLLIDEVYNKLDRLRDRSLLLCAENDHKVAYCHIIKELRPIYSELVNIVPFSKGGING